MNRTTLSYQAQRCRPHAAVLDSGTGSDTFGRGEIFTPTKGYNQGELVYLCYRQLTVHPQVHLKGRPQQDRPVQAPPVQLWQGHQVPASNPDLSTNYGRGRKCKMLPSLRTRYGGENPEGGNKHLDAFEPWALTLQGKLHPTGVIYRTVKSKTTGAWEL